MRSALLTLFLVLTASAGLGQQEQDPTGLDPRWETERRSWTGQLEVGQSGRAASVTVVNEFGDIRTRPSADSQVEVNAVIQRREDVTEAVDLSIVEGDGAITIEVRFPATSIDPELLVPGRSADRRVDLVVFVPGGSELTARTLRGLLEAKGLTADARLRSDRGDLVVTTTGSLDARTEQGSISAIFLASDWSTSPRLETLTGDIRVELPPHTNALGHLSTRFEITTDYSIEIERQGLLRTGLATIGDGGRDIFLESHKGALKLLESIE